jgi:hypothetical protein
MSALDSDEGDGISVSIALSHGNDLSDRTVDDQTPPETEGAVGGRPELAPQIRTEAGQELDIVDR